MCKEKYRNIAEQNERRGNNIIQFIGISFKIVFSPQKIYGKARSDVIITGIYFLIIIH
jgi:hypothetical protein